MDLFFPSGIEQYSTKFETYYNYACIFFYRICSSLVINFFDFFAPYIYSSWPATLPGTTRRPGLFPSTCSWRSGTTKSCDKLLSGVTIAGRCLANIQSILLPKKREEKPECLYILIRYYQRSCFFFSLNGGRSGG